MNSRHKVLALLMSVMLVTCLSPVSAFADGELAASGTTFSTQAVGTDDYPVAYKGKKKGAVADQWGFSNREDTSFVAWRLNNDNGIAFDSWYKGAHWTSAADWGVAAKSAGLVVDGIPAVGSVAWWKTGAGEHVAWVQSVTGTSITVEEYDRDGKGTYATRTLDRGGVSGFIHIKDMNSSGSTLPTTDVDLLPGVYSITPKCAENMQLTIAGASPESGANAQLGKAKSALSQSFAITGTSSAYTISPLCSDGKCLDVQDNSTTPGTNVRQWGANGAAAQKWTLRSAGDGYYYIRAANGLVLDVAGGASKAGTNVQAYTFNGTDAQKWRLDVVQTKVADDRYAFTPECAPKYRLDINKGALEAGANAQIYQSDNASAQAFTVSASGDSYLISPLSADKMNLDLEKGSSTPGTNVRQWGANGATAQEWTFQDAGDGYYFIRAANGLYLDVEKSAGVNFTNVRGYTFSGTSAQKWRLDEVTSKDMSFVRVTVKDMAYTGSKVKPKPTVVAGSAQLKLGRDYKLAYKKNLKVGTATVQVKGIGSYSGSKVVTFAIAQAAIGKASSKAIAAKTYTGKPVTPKPKLSYKGVKLALGTDYTLSYENNVERGTAKVIATGTGNFKGTKTMKFKIA